MKYYNITVNGVAYSVSVEETAAGAAPVAAAAPAAPKAPAAPAAAPKAAAPAGAAGAGLHDAHLDLQILAVNPAVGLLVVIHVVVDHVPAVLDELLSNGTLLLRQAKKTTLERLKVNVREDAGKIQQRRNTGRQRYRRTSAWIVSGS